MLKIKYSEIIILGSGPSGYTSSLYIIRNKLNPINISGKVLGGQLTKTNYVDNWPSIKRITGYDLMFNFYSQLINFNIEIYFDEMYSIDFLTTPYIIFSKNYLYKSEFLIISTGVSYSIFNIKNYKKYLKSNISSCAICDANFYNKKNICAIGGGDSCFENIFYLTNFYESLILINRNKLFVAEVFLLKKFFFNLKKFTFFKLNYFLIEFIGDDFFLIYIKVKNFFNININVYFLDGLFLFIGNRPNSLLFFGQIKIKKNFILIRKNQFYKFSLTSLNKIYSAGDVSDFLYKQAITASGFGCISYFDLLNYYNKIF